MRLLRVLCLTAAALVLPSAASSAQGIGAECSDCHGSIVERYRASGMARALGPIEAGELAGLDAVQDAAGWRYSFEQSSSGASWLVETRAQAPGESGSAQPHRLSLPLAFAIGAGRLDRSYAALRGTQLVFAPLEKLAAHAHAAPRAQAALAPGHSIQAGLRFDSPLTNECLACHTDRLPPQRYPLALAPAAALWQPQGIGCGACHAQASEHAVWRAAQVAERAPASSDPLLSHSSLSRIQRVSVCAGCHLQGDVRLEFDAGHLGPPAPGADLLAQRALFVAAQPSDEVGFVSQVERLALSACFQRSPELACETCHDPHSAQDLPAVRAATRAACGQCHSPSVRPCELTPAQRGAQDCAGCHLPLVPVFDVAGVRIHDHFIRERPSAPPAPKLLRAAEAGSGPIALFSWPGEPRPAYAEEPGLWMMAEYRLGRFEAALARTEQPLGTLATRLPMAQHARGALLERAGKLDAARLAYKRALILDPQAGEPATNLSIVLARLGQAPAGLALLDSLLSVSPQAEGALRNRAILRIGSGDKAGFRADLERAFELYPSAAAAEALWTEAQDGDDAERIEHWHSALLTWDPLRR